jgi:hypothetical protein
MSLLYPLNRSRTSRSSSRDPDPREQEGGVLHDLREQEGGVLHDPREQEGGVLHDLRDQETTA